MKLTNYIRDAFIRAAMAEVPKVDYEDQALALITPEFKKLFERTFPGLNREELVSQLWFKHRHYKTPGSLRNVMEYGPDGYDYIQVHMPKLWGELEKLGEKHSAQAAARSSLESKLRGIVYGCTTRKALVEALPEFEKYLPAEEPKSMRSLPAIANVVADFTRAGWPKQEAQVAT